jgi:phosphoserine phosphatase
MGFASPILPLPILPCQFYQAKSYPSLLLEQAMKKHQQAPQNQDQHSQPGNSSEPLQPQGAQAMLTLARQVPLPLCLDLDGTLVRAQTLWKLLTTGPGSHRHPMDWLLMKRDTKPHPIQSPGIAPAHAFEQGSCPHAAIDDGSINVRPPDDGAIDNGALDDRPRDSRILDPSSPNPKSSDQAICANTFVNTRTSSCQSPKDTIKPIRSPLSCLGLAVASVLRDFVGNKQRRHLWANWKMHWTQAIQAQSMPAMASWAAGLVYHRTLVQLALSWPERIYLVTGAPTPIAHAVGRHLDHLLREQSDNQGPKSLSMVWSSSSNCNLVGKAKADLLSDRLGHKAFYYVGDSWQDLPVWQASAAIATVALPTSQLGLYLKRHATVDCPLFYLGQD